MMLGFLLARNGISVTVLEKHRDFLRDFRGDTLHPSTLRALDDIGLCEQLLDLPHTKAFKVTARIGGQEIVPADFSHMDPRYNFIAFMPQWDFLNFISTQAKRFENFDLRMDTEAIGLVHEDGKVAGVRYQTGERVGEVRARLTIACDGRDSQLRDMAGLVPKKLGAPMDVLWFSLPHKDGDGIEPWGQFGRGGIFIALYRGDYWQCALVISKGGFEKLKDRGLDAMRTQISHLSPFDAERTGEITGWDDVHLLSVTVDRLEKWYQSGLLFIGDAAHAMSPVGGVGINLAIQDAIATANILTPAFQHGTPDDDALAQVQKRRMWPAKVTQWMQVQAQERIIRTALAADQPLKVPWLLRLFSIFSILRRIPAYAIGMGIRPERIETFEAVRSDTGDD